MDKAILKSLKEGDEYSFNTIYNKYFPLIKYICYSYLKNNIDAEDLTLDVFTKIWEKRDSIDITKNFKYYLTQIAHNHCKNYLRNKSRVILKDTITLDESNKSEDVIDRDNTDIKSIIKHYLDEESYEILILHYFHQLKYRQIAKIKNVNVSVITNKASRAMRLLKERLKNED